MLLSILIASITGRERQLATLIEELSTQIKDCDAVELIEVIHCTDNRQMSIGAKRQALLEAATGAYIVYCDDDDQLSNNYLSEVLKALLTLPDCVGFNGTMTTNGKQSERWEISMRNKIWGKKHGRYLRHTNHLTPVKRDIAIKVGFKDIRHSEDYEYSMGLIPHLKTEVFIDKELYYYNYISKK